MLGRFITPKMRINNAHLAAEFISITCLPMYYFEGRRGNFSMTGQYESASIFSSFALEYPVLMSPNNIVSTNSLASHSIINEERSYMKWPVTCLMIMRIQRVNDSRCGYDQLRRCFQHERKSRRKERQPLREENEENEKRH